MEVWEASAFRRFRSESVDSIQCFDLNDLELVRSCLFSIFVLCVFLVARECV